MFIESHSPEIVRAANTQRHRIPSLGIHTYHSHEDKLPGNVSSSTCRLHICELNRRLTSTACTGGSKLLSFFTPTFIKEKNNWEAATSIKPTLPSTTSRPCLAYSEVRRRIRKYGDADPALFDVVGAGIQETWGDRGTVAWDVDRLNAFVARVDGITILQRRSLPSKTTW